MGRGNKRGKRGGGRGGGQRKSQDDRTDLIEKIGMQNDRFFSYYKAQKIVPDDEWDSFVGSLRQHLPTTFRVAGSREIANTLNATIKDVHVPSLSNVVFEGQNIPPPVQIPWYPDGLAWQFNVPKKVLRRSPEFKKFHSFLVFETEVGNVSRQEAVSMLPPLFLEVEPHHRCLDMCAAPGSKTAQILEALHAHDTATATSIPLGLLIANDSDNKRTHLLIHQSARLPSPALMVTNLDASNYPSIRIPVTSRGAASAAEEGAAEKPKTQPLYFDRILCDVPCSGDGTIRKNMGIWKSWLPMDANGLHGLQVRILLRAMNLLENNGRIVYSTCSLNPVENEAVIAEALTTNGVFELVNVSSKLPELQRRPGLETWYPTTDRTGARTFESYEEFMASDVDDIMKGKMTEGHWPPANVEKLNLTRCMRIYPHLQDSGGFFVAVLQKVKKTSNSSATNKRDLDADVDDAIASDLPESKRARISEDPSVGQSTPVEEENAMMTDDSAPEAIDSELVDDADADGDGDDDGAVDKSEVVAIAPSDVPIVIQAKETKHSKRSTSDGGTGSFKENPYTFLRADDPILTTCIKRLHITSTFPSANVLVRNPSGDAARSLYLVNNIVKAIIHHNDYERIRLTAAGTKVFAKQEAGKGTEAQFRVLGEGLPVVLPYVNPESIIKGDMGTLKTLVESYYPLCAAFGEPFRGVIEMRGSGSHIVRFPLGNLDGVVLTHDLVLPIWKSNVSLTLMIDKKAKSALSLRLFGTDITTAGKEVQAGLLQKEQEKILVQLPE